MHANRALERTSLQAIRRNADKLCAAVAGLTLAAGLALAFPNPHYLAILGIAVALAAVSLGWTALRGGTNSSMVIQALVFAGASVLNMQTSHYAPFSLETPLVLLGVLLMYRNPLPIVLMGASTLLFQFVFIALTEHTLLSTVLSSAIMLGLATALMIPLARRLAVHAALADESVLILSRLHNKGKVNFATPIAANSKGEISDLAKTFNEYAENMTFVVAGFQMLKSDIQEMAQLTEPLGHDHVRQQDENNAAAHTLREFVSHLGKQTRLGQNTAELSKKMTDDCFDLINELNQSVEQLNKINKQAFDCNRLVEDLAHDEHEGEVQTRTLQSLNSALGHLAERTQQFMTRMDSFKTGLSAIENQSVSVDRATHQWVESGHANQRKGWEVLGILERMQARTDQVFSVMSNGINTVTRSRDVIKELDRRLERFEV